MRIFLSLLIFVPLLSFNQSKLDLRDLKSISSKSTFQKVVLENGFSKSSVEDWRLSYGYNLDKDYQDPKDYRASTWAFFYLNETYYEDFMFRFFKPNLESEKSYRKIVRQIQSSCNFHSIEEYSDYDIIYYGCPGAKFKGVIGYFEFEDNFYIKTKKPTRN